MPEPNEIYSLEQEGPDIKEFLLKLYKKKWLILSCLVIAGTLSLIYSFKAQPVYRATTRILVEPTRPKIVKFEDVSLSEYRDATFYNTQVAILKSTAIARLVYQKLGGYDSWKKAGKRAEASKVSPLVEDKINALLASIIVKQIPGSHLIEISVEDVDPERAAKIADAWVDAYISYTMESRFDVTKYATSWLEKEIKKVKEQLKKAEQALQKYRRQHNIVDASTKQTEDTALLDQLVRRKAELEVALSQQLNYYKEKHPVIIGIRSELSSIEKKIEEEKQRLLALKEKAVTYNILQREVETNQTLYDSLLNRLKETESIENLTLSNIKVIDKAKPPKFPVRPNKKVNLIRALFLGLFLGTGLSIFLDKLDQSIKTPEDIKKGLNLSVLGLIPFDYRKNKGSLPELITVQDPHSQISEAYRSLRTDILYSNPDIPKKTLVVTSASPREGKTTVSTNLAIVFAQAGERTLLIDTDFRNPKLHRIFNLSREEGITEALVNNIEDFTSYLHSTEIPNLDLLICGKIPPNPSELLGSKSMEVFIQKLTQAYDKIIFDTPPVLAVSDAVILSTRTDAIFLVVKENTTHRKAALRAKEIITSVKANLLGAVLNMSKPGKGYGYYYYYYYSYGQERKKRKRRRGKD